VWWWGLGRRPRTTIKKIKSHEETPPRHRFRDGLHRHQQGSDRPGTPVPLGSYLQDQAGNLYQVILQPVQKVAPAAAPVAAPVAAAPVAAAPVVVQQPAQPQVVYVQQPAAAPQGNAVGNYVGKTLKTGVAGGAQGAVLGAITGRNVGKEALGMAGGAAAGQVTTDIIGGLFGK